MPAYLSTVTAVLAAVVAAVGFGTAAYFQQQVVAAAVVGLAGNDPASGSTRLSLSALRSLVRQRRWLAGWGLFGVASLIHLSALVLAPVSVVQPVGVLAVPVAVILGTRAARRSASARVLLGVALSVAGTAGFVLLSSTATASAATAPVWSGLLTASLVVAVAVAVLVVVAGGMASRRASGVVRCLAYAAAGATCFGFSSASIRLIARAVDTGGVSALVLVAGAGVTVALIVGSWAVQQSYAAGPAAAVVGTLTVGDPQVAIGLSAGFLGEGVHHGAAGVAAMVGCAAVAAVGTWLLARYYPAAGGGPDDGPPPALQAESDFPEIDPQRFAIDPQRFASQRTPR